jgi:NAD-dependent SIR2 family protein deacetylase
VEPNSTHYAIVDLQNMGKMKYLISQNIDNLHLKSGIRFDLLAELHGNRARLRCTSCQQTVEHSTSAKRCECGGSLTSSVVGFGMSLPQKDLMDSFEHSSRSDLFIVIGSSLVVTPAANMPGEAIRSGSKLVIINRGETPYDRVAHLKFEESIGEVFPVAVDRLKKIVSA